MRRFLFHLLLTALAVGNLMAHADPRGEIHPQIQLAANGNFRVFFTYQNQGIVDSMTLLLAPDGRELIPRHRLSPQAMQKFGLSSSSNDRFNHPLSTTGIKAPAADVIALPGPGNNTRLALVEAKSSPSAPGAARPLPYDPVPETPDSFALSTHYVAIITMVFASDQMTPVQGMFRCCRRDGGKAGYSTALERVGTIYDNPITSAPVWSANRFWVAWVQERGDKENPNWRTVLTEMDPETGRTAHHDLPGLSHWNTSIDLEVNSDGILCAAWAPSLDGSYPGIAKVVTAVFPTRP